eukprot:TRINITY_DN9682_c0_g1_i1.p1 TRINITY_DN9682_c0_g1~~TRINITY_DN9682_c0_g1_i1.p1  ORF type:complete len:346 (+),score=67.58 TRINITY_DN9682_c0_g1_i1:93-1040(+)
MAEGTPADEEDVHLPRDAAGLSKDAPSAFSGSAPSKEVRGERRALKVEKFHKNLIRKEVWRQKFDYLFRQMQEGLENEIVRDRQVRRPSVKAATAALTLHEGASEEVKAALHLKAQRLAEEIESKEGSSGKGSRKVSREVASISSSKSAGSPWTSPVKKLEDADSSSFATGGDAELGQLQLPPKLQQAGWRRLGPKRFQPPTAPRMSASASGNRTKSALGMSQSRSTGKFLAGAKTMPSFRPQPQGINGILNSSSSLPLLQPSQELWDVREDYYQGDDLFMHEDILHASNPELFPLRVGSGKAFPLLKLADMAQD